MKKQLLLILVCAVALCVDHNVVSQTVLWTAQNQVIQKHEVGGEKVDYYLPSTLGISVNQRLVNDGTKFYGVTKKGGALGGGTLFEFDVPTEKFKLLKGFNGLADGLSLSANLTLTSKGVLVGASTTGGAGYGKLYSYVTKSGNFSTFGALTVATGYWFKGQLAEINGKLYGATIRGGQYGLGSIVEIDVASKQIKNLYSFQKSDGKPAGGVVKTAAGKITLLTEGAKRSSNSSSTTTSGYVITFDVNTKSITKVKDLYTWGNGKGTPFLASNGKLYGLTSWGPYYRGGFFELDLTTKKFTFTEAFKNSYGAKMWDPHGALVQSADGNLYGFTDHGGIDNFGAIFRYNLASKKVSHVKDYANVQNLISSAGLAVYCPSGDCIAAGGAEKRGLKSDSLLLVKLFNATDGKNWIRNTNWLEGPIKTWYGLRFKEVYGEDRVSGIQLNSNNLNGNVPVFTSEDNKTAGLHEVTLLDMSYNKLTGELTSGFVGQLSKVNILYLDDNEISGVSDKIRDLKDLSYLGLSRNKLSSFPDVLGEMAKIANVSLYNNLFTAWPFTQLPNRGITIDMSSNEITQSGSFVKALGLGRYRLRLVSNRFRKEAIDILVNQYPNAAVDAQLQKNADQLDDQNLNVEKVGVMNISVPVVQGAQKYRWITIHPNISINNGRRGMTYWTKSNAPTLDIRDNNVVLSCYPEFRLRNSGTYSYLHQNINIGQAYGAYQKVNFIDSLGLVQLYSQMKGDSWLNNTNWLKGPVHTWYGVKKLDENGYVVELDLSSNEISGSLPSNFELGFLVPFGKLKLFDVSNNKLRGEVPAKLLKLFKNIEVIKLSNNSLSGAIPKEIGELTHLKVVYASYCNITGLPDELFTIPSLELVYLQSNSITEFPVASVNSPKLSYLTLSRNKIASVPNSTLKYHSKYLSIDVNENSILPVDFLRLQGMKGASTYLTARSQELPIVEGKSSASAAGVQVSVPMPSGLSYQRINWYDGWGSNARHLGSSNEPNTLIRSLPSSASRIRAEIQYNASYSVNQRITLKMNPDFAPDFSFTTNEDQRYGFNIASKLGQTWIQKVYAAGITSISDAKVTLTKQPQNGSIYVSGTYINYLPKRNFNGNDIIEYTISSRKNPSISDAGSITVKVNPVNDPPVISLNKRVFEVEFGKTVSIPVNANDEADGSSASPIYVYTQQSRYGTARYDSGTKSIIYTPRYNTNLRDYFFVYARERNGGHLSSHKLIVRVNIKPSANTAPVANNRSVNLRMNWYARVYPSVSDKETPSYRLKTYVSYPLATNGRVYKSGSAFIYYPNYNFSGSDRFYYYANDGQLNSKKATVSLNVKGNQAPVLRSRVTHIQLGRDGYESRPISSIAYDDNTPAYYLRIQPNYYNGRYANDYTSRYVSVYRERYRRCYTHRWGWWGRSHSHCYSYNTNNLAFRATWRAWRTYNWMRRYYRGRNVNFGSLPYTVSDRNGNRTTGWFYFSMSPWYKNAELDAAEQDLPEIFTHNDTVIAYYNQADTVFFEAIGLPGASVSMEVSTPPALGSLTQFKKQPSELTTIYTGMYTPTVNEQTLDSCEIKVSDDKGNTVYYWNYFNIKSEPVAPVLAEIETQVGREDENLSIELPLTDGDDVLDSLQYDIQYAIGDTNYMSNVVIEDGKAVIEFMPPSNFTDSLMCFVTVSDKDAQFTQQRFFIYIEPVNDEPEIIVDTTFYEVLSGEPLDMLALALDVDEDDELVMRYDNKPDWLSVADSASDVLLFSGTPNANDAGSYELELSVTDGESFTFKKVNIVVVDVDDQAPIVANPMADVRLPKSTKQYEIDVNNVFSDPDGDELFLSLIDNSNEDWIQARLVDNKLKLSIINPAYLGLAQLTVEAMANGKSAVAVVNVETPDQAPVSNRELGNVDVLRSSSAENVDITGLFTDPDGDDMDIYVSDNTYSDMVNAVISGNQLQLKFNGKGGTSYVTVTAEAYGKKADVTLEVSVKDIAPTLLEALPDTTIYKNHGVLAYDLSTAFYDYDDATVLKSVTSVSDSSLIESIEVIGDQLLLTPKQDVAGELTLEITGQSNQQSVSDEVVVKIMDRAPQVVKYFGTAYVSSNPEVLVYDLNEHFTDPDGEKLTFAVEGNSNEPLVKSLIVDGMLYLNVSPDLDGIAGVKVSASADGKSVNATLRLMVGYGVAVDQLTAQNGFEVYPNPSNLKGWYLTVNGEEKSNLNYSIYSLNGVLLKSGFANNGQFIKASNMSEGYYLLKLLNDGGAVTIPVILK